MEGERVVFIEESNPQRYVKLVASGEIDETLLDAAVALYVAHYNFCRVHETLRVTPAMQLRVTDHIWTIGELVDAALEGVVPGPGGRRYGRFTVIEGGRD
jgi:hypothetical protein